MYTSIADEAGNAMDDRIRRDADGAIIPVDPLSAAWQDYQAWCAEGNEPAPAPAPPTFVPGVISDRQFAQALALDGTITEAEALAWAARGERPDAMEDTLDHIPDTNGQRFGARMMLSAATSYERHLPLTEQLGALLTNPATGKPYDAAALDALWTRAANL